MVKQIVYTVVPAMHCMSFIFVLLPYLSAKWNILFTNTKAQETTLLW